MAKMSTDNNYSQMIRRLSWWFDHHHHDFGW